MARPLAVEADQPHVIVCGLDSIGLRTAQELCRLGQSVTAVAERPRDEFVAVLRHTGANLILGSCRDEAVLRSAGLDHAKAIALLDEDEIANIHAALAAQDVNAGIRIVLRLFHQELREHMRMLFRDAIALSASALAAPAFVNAALGGDGEQRFTLDGVVYAIRREAPTARGVLLPLAGPESAADSARREPDRPLCIVREAFGSPQPRASRASGRVVSAARALDRRLLVLLGVVAGLVTLSATIFHLFAGLALIDAFYFAVTVITTTGFGDINLRDAPAVLKVYGSLLMLLGASSLAVLFGLIADLLVGARLARQLTSIPKHVRDHIVVCGLGSVGFRIVESLRHLGIYVAAAELRPSDFVPAARALGVPVLQADARHRATLKALRVDRARCLIAATDDDVTNLAAALGARALKPDLRIVARFFDPDFAERVERAFGIQASRSVSALAAPAFAAAVLGHEVIAAAPSDGTVLVIARVRVRPKSLANGARADELARQQIRLLLIDGANGAAALAADRPLRENDDLLLVSTREALPAALAWFAS